MFSSESGKCCFTERKLETLELRNAGEEDNDDRLRTQKDQKEEGIRIQSIQQLGRSCAVNSLQNDSRIRSIQFGPMLIQEDLQYVSQVTDIRKVVEQPREKGMVAKMMKACIKMDDKGSPIRHLGKQYWVTGRKMTRGGGDGRE